MRTGLKQAARSLGRRLLSRLPGSAQRYEPDFSDHAMLAALDAKAVTRSAGSGATDGEFGSAAVSTERQVADHFRLRPRPRPLIEPSAAADLVRRLGESLPQCREVVEKFARAFVNDGVAIYGMQGPRLDAATQWARLAAGPAADRLYLVQPHRFAFLPPLVLASGFGTCSIETVSRVLQAWMEFAANEKGESAYTSNLVVAQRFVACSIAWGLVYGVAESPSRTRCAYLLLKIMRADAAFLVPRIGSSAPNNHLLVDGFIGWYIGALFPEFADARERKAEFEALFLRELGRQVLPDGSGFEHSSHYHEMGCELACAYCLWSGNNGERVPDELLDRLRGMLEFQVALGAGSGYSWAIGDATEDPVFALEPCAGAAGGAMFELYRALFAQGLPSAPAGDASVMRAYWLLSGTGNEGSRFARAAVRQLAPGSMRVFADGGYVAFEGGEERYRVMLRTGPAPGGPIHPGHAHADLLSVLVAVDGVPLIVDPGTYSYRHAALSAGENRVDWRGYFVGPEAHNGPCIDGIDPLGRMAGDFRDPEHGKTRVRMSRCFGGSRFRGVEAIIASGNAYDGVRRGVIRVGGEYFVIYDRIPATTQRASCSYGFQFAPGVQASVDALSCVARSGGTQLSLHASSGFDCAAVSCGSFGPPAGWVSERYGHLSAAPQVRYRPQPTEELTAFVFFTAQQNGRIEVDASLADGAFHIRVQAPEHTDHIVLPAGSGAARIEKAGIVFQGEALWLRQRLDTELHIRCVGASRVECADVQLWHDGPKTGGELDARYADGRLTASAHEGQLAWSVLRKPGSRG